MNEKKKGEERWFEVRVRLSRQIGDEARKKLQNTIIRDIWDNLVDDWWTNCIKKKETLKRKRRQVVLGEGKEG